MDHHHIRSSVHRDSDLSPPHSSRKKHKINQPIGYSPTNCLEKPNHSTPKKFSTPSRRDQHTPDLPDKTRQRLDMQIHIPFNLGNNTENEEDGEGRPLEGRVNRILNLGLGEHEIERKILNSPYKHIGTKEARIALDEIIHQIPNPHPIMNSSSTINLGDTDAQQSNLPQKLFNDSNDTEEDDLIGDDILVLGKDMFSK
jgi:hypothetical protein